MRGVIAEEGVRFMSDLQRPLLRLADGDVISFEDSHFQESGGCETCGYGGEIETELTITFLYHSGKGRRVEIEGMNGSYALTYVMQNLSAFPTMTVEEFLHGLRTFCK